MVSFKTAIFLVVTINFANARKYCYPNQCKDASKRAVIDERTHSCFALASAVDKFSFKDSISECANQGGSLATLDSRQLPIVTSELDKDQKVDAYGFTALRQAVYLNLQVNLTDQQYYFHKFDSNIIEPAYFIKWAPGEPNNRGRAGNEAVGEYIPGFGFNDISPKHSRRALCQYHARHVVGSRPCGQFDAGARLLRLLSALIE